MARQIIRIDEEKCDGCGLCAAACHEGAIDIIGGKARLAREAFCDGLGACLPACPAGAISLESGEALPCGEEAATQAQEELRSALRQWPVQIRLVSATAPFLRECDLLLAADCTAYAFAAMHEKLMSGRATLIGCPKLDGACLSEKISAIIAQNDIRSVAVAKMEVPCCTGLQLMAERALKLSGKDLPFQAVTISRDGRIVG